MTTDMEAILLEMCVKERRKKSQMICYLIQKYSEQNK